MHDYKVREISGETEFRQPLDVASRFRQLEQGMMPVRFDTEVHTIRSRKLAAQGQNFHVVCKRQNVTSRMGVDFYRIEFKGVKILSL
jgi:hypothetical protein